MTDTPKPAPAKTLPCLGCGKPIVFQSNGVWGHASSSDALECRMGVTQPAPATPAATPLREANQQRVDAAAQRVRQAMDYRKYLPGDPFRKDVELLIEIALAPVLEIFAPAQPAATPMAARSDPKILTAEDIKRIAGKGHRCGFQRAPSYAEFDCDCQCGMSYDENWNGIISHAGRFHPECKCKPAAAQSQRESEQPEQAEPSVELMKREKRFLEDVLDHLNDKDLWTSQTLLECRLDTLREALDGWIEAHQRLDHSGITDCTRCKRIAEIQSRLELAALSPQTDSQEPR